MLQEKRQKKIYFLEPLIGKKDKNAEVFHDVDHKLISLPLWVMKSVILYFHFNIKKAIKEQSKKLLKARV